MAKGLDRVPGRDQTGDTWKRSNISNTLKDITREIERIKGRQLMKTTLLPSTGKKQGEMMFI